MKYNLDMLDIVDDEKKLLNFLRMEKWIADRPDHPGEAAKQWLKDLYQQNKLVKNELELDGRRVDLGHITMPVLNVYAKDDHIIPPATSRALGPKVGTKDYTELALPGGHVGVFVGGKSQKLFAPGIADCLQQARLSRAHEATRSSRRRRRRPSSRSATRSRSPASSASARRTRC